MVFDDVKVSDVFRDKQKGIILTVTENTDKGFKYNCTPHHVYPARMGPSLVKSGELFWKQFPEQDWNVFYEKVE